MPINTTVLFDMPQREIASLIRGLASKSIATHIVSGFVTVEGIKAIEADLLTQPQSIKTLVVGAGTFQAYSALDRLLANGVPASSLYVHLGHARNNSKRKPFKYHPMLHSKVYYFEHSNGHATAIIGSHNITGFALTGKNGEAAVKLEGEAGSSEMRKIKAHIDNAKRQSVKYVPGMKESFSWWTSQFLEGLLVKSNDRPSEYENKKTIIILGVAKGGVSLAKDSTLYFELPKVLGKITSLKAEVHLFIFDKLPKTPALALSQIRNAKSSHWCNMIGVDSERGNKEVTADFCLLDHLTPEIAVAKSPFRPTPKLNAQQARAKAYNSVATKYEYLFDKASAEWKPIYDESEVLKVESDAGLIYEKQAPNYENYEWFLVAGLEPDTGDDDATPYSMALRSLSPESGSYVLMSTRRRILN